MPPERILGQPQKAIASAFDDGPRFIWSARNIRPERLSSAGERLSRL